MLTGIYTGTAADTAVNIINLLMDTHYAEIVEVCLHTVVWTSGNSNLDMVVGREDQLLNLSCQLVGIYITLNTVCVSDTGHDVAGAGLFLFPCLGVSRGSETNEVLNWSSSVRAASNVR